MVKQGIVKNFEEIKSGVGKYGKWTLYRLTLEDGFVATTFEPIYADQIGKAVILNVEETTNEKNGVKYTNYSIVPSKPKKESVVAQNKKFEELMGAIAEMNGLLVKIDLDIQDIKKSRPKDNPF